MNDDNNIHDLVKTTSASSSVEALETLYKNSFSSLVGFAALFVSGKTLAEEIVQDVFTSALTRCLQNRNYEIDTPDAFIKQAIVNRSRSYHRRNFLRAAKEDSLQYQALSDSPEFSNSRYDLINTAIDALPQSQRECIVLRFYEDMKVAEIAAVLGISEGTVKSHLHRASAAIKAAVNNNAKDAQ